MESFSKIIVTLLFVTIYCAPSLPPYFDARDQWKNCNISPRDQGECTSTWAHALVGMVEDRYCIARNKEKVSFSAKALMACSKNVLCNGEFTEATVTEHIVGGVYLAGCIPDDGKAPDASLCPTSANSCTGPVKSVERFPCTDFITYVKEEDVKNSLMERGPLVLFFDEDAEIKDYYSGIYYIVRVQKGKGIHGLKIIGWGRENGITYWTAQSALGTSFGENGIIRLKMSDYPLSGKSALNPRFLACNTPLKA